MIKRHHHRPSRTVSLSLITRRLASYAATVVGSGPAGVAVVGNLLDNNITPINWVDRSFSGGRIGRLYRHVPSNTKVKRFVDYADALDTFQKIIAEAPGPGNAYKHMRKLDQEDTCRVGEAAELCLLLTRGLDKFETVHKTTGIVNSAASSTEPGKRGWSVQVDSETLTSDRLILCTGSSPKSIPSPLRSGPAPISIHLDLALDPKKLAAILPPHQSLTVGLIGSSHSAILVLRSLAQLSISTHLNLRIKWFVRNSLSYAQEMPDGWILRDNTGLKGAAADWARANLEDFAEGAATSKAVRNVQKIDLPKDSSAAGKVWQKHLPRCTHVVQAVGFERDPLPLLSRDGEVLEGLEYDAQGGGFTTANGNGKEGEAVRGLYGAGIAWPERVTDPHGNVEHAVGMWKFMKFLKRVVPGWTA